jgi:hypothetical protein
MIGDGFAECWSGLPGGARGNHGCKGRIRLRRAKCDEAPPCMRWRGLALPRGPSLPIARGPNASQLPPVSDSAVSTGRPALPALPSVSLGLNPSSVVRNFYCQLHPPHKAFPPSLQDSFVVHRTSGVYPLCTVPFHWTMHRSVHSCCGQPTGRPDSAAAGSLLRRFAEVARGR